MQHLPKELVYCEYSLYICLRKLKKHQIINFYSAIFYTLSKQAKSLGASKLHLQTNIKLQSLKPPHGVQDQIDASRNRLLSHNTNLV